MASRTQLLSECKHALESFLQSSSAFRIIRTVPVSQPSPASTSNAKTLFIFDSSFNPPSRAHASLAISALASQRLDKYPKPHRLLLLFSTHNADKGPTPAAFEHRLALMIVFAEDLAARLASSGEASTSPSSSRLHHEAAHLNPTTPPHTKAQETPPITTPGLAIDIALTTKPYYNDKSTAITSSTPPPYPSNPQHIHITGFDTITRIFAAKYYTHSSPPFAVLDPFFAAHGLRVTVRPDEKSVAGMAVEAQLNWAEEVLRAGKLEEEGAKREWADRIEIVEAEEEGRGVSSTRIREAVGRGNWEGVEGLTTRGVAGWVREFGLYGANGGG